MPIPDTDVTTCLDGLADLRDAINGIQQTQTNVLLRMANENSAKIAVFERELADQKQRTSEVEQTAALVALRCNILEQANKVLNERLEACEKFVVTAADLLVKQAGGTPQQDPIVADVLAGLPQPEPRPDATEALEDTTKG